MALARGPSLPLWSATTWSTSVPVWSVTHVLGILVGPRSTPAARRGPRSLTTAPAQARLLTDLVGVVSASTSRVQRLGPTLDGRGYFVALREQDMQEVILPARLRGGMRRNGGVPGSGARLNVQKRCGPCRARHVAGFTGHSTRDTPRCPTTSGSPTAPMSRGCSTPSPMKRSPTPPSSTVIGPATLTCPRSCAWPTARVPTKRRARCSTRLRSRSTPNAPSSPPPRSMGRRRCRSTGRSGSSPVWLSRGSSSVSTRPPRSAACSPPARGWRR
jgi:hypothetical protein